jgi:hypothetical protein
MEQKWVKPYPEVTGYLLSYFSGSSIMKPDLTESVKKLLELQLPDGSWPSFYGDLTNGYTFDTSQILHGLLKQNWVVSKKLDASVNQALGFLEGRMKFIFPLSRARENGSGFEIFRKRDWAYGVSPINFKLAELLEVVPICNPLSHPRLPKKIERMRRFSRVLPQLEEAHPGAYQLEGLLALGKIELVKQRLTQYFMPDNDGKIPAYPGAEFSYNSGSVQLAILWAKCGCPDISQNILSNILQYVETWNDHFLTMPQYSGTASPHMEYSTWGVKYLCELLTLMRRDFCEI